MRKVFRVLLPLALVWGAVVWFLQRVWFYRDPVRITPQDEANIISPCDGQVVYLRRIEDGVIHSEKLGQVIRVEEITHAEWPAASTPGRGWLIGIYMSPLDVHFNYAPIAGQISGIYHTGAKANLPMVDLWEYVQLTWLRRAVDLFAKRYALENERQTVFIEGRIKIAMVEIADKFVNKIRTYIEVGDTVRPGQKVSFIERGSQVDLFLFSEDLEFHVGVGDQVYGGQTVLATLKTPQT
ncbi:phosphatidylserine decarboxylase [Deinococcus peraridilitoris]|uniref:Phosphatidylserine decarboxylase n=1 Tax=Deinococcus peraridilitoris (strain DSM 19664 / LMG 22246 / CIP 109416 / KR-200) TaxID=937777 RepID=L0A844_DEIPD|nr:phosphatidylserine decarboxylase [Deinococcus peraridilitoris]AFZ69230.1 phosphatidylserine decarboxylase [Deinococcus peraridilitoris DSM 19664]